MSKIDKRLRIVVPEQFTANSKLDLFGLSDYLKTDKSVIDFEYQYESETKKNFINWWKNVVDITKWYLKD